MIVCRQSILLIGGQNAIGLFTRGQPPAESKRIVTIHSDNRVRFGLFETGILPSSQLAVIGRWTVDIDGIRIPADLLGVGLQVLLGGDEPLHARVYVMSGLVDEFLEITHGHLMHAEQDIGQAGNPDQLHAQ